MTMWELVIVVEPKGPSPSSGSGSTTMTSGGNNARNTLLRQYYGNEQSSDDDNKDTVHEDHNIMAIIDDPTLPPPPPPPPRHQQQQQQQEERRRRNQAPNLIRFRQYPMERYEHDYHRQMVSQITPVVTLRRKTTFFACLLFLAQMAYVDTYHFLPIGTILYSIGIGLVLELLEMPDEEQFPMIHNNLEQQRRQRDLQQQRRRWEEFRKVQDLVEFEYLVLRGDSVAPKVVTRYEDGRIVYYIA